MRKDTNGNLSLFKDGEDGNVYILNKVNTGQDAIMQTISTQKFEDIEQKNFTKISHTYGSNIRDWWRYSIDNYYNINDNDKPSPIKRFGRTLIGQNGMTGECLCGRGCLSCCNSGYNDESFYSKANINETNKQLQKNIKSI